MDFMEQDDYFVSNFEDSRSEIVEVCVRIVSSLNFEKRCSSFSALLI